MSENYPARQGGKDNHIAQLQARVKELEEQLSMYEAEEYNRQMSEQYGGDSGLFDPRPNPNDVPFEGTVQEAWDNT